jgi:hypothetical protein
MTWQNILIVLNFGINHFIKWKFAEHMLKSRNPNSHVNTYKLGLESFQYSMYYIILSLLGVNNILMNANVL